MPPGSLINLSSIFSELALRMQRKKCDMAAPDPSASSFPAALASERRQTAAKAHSGAGPWRLQAGLPHPKPEPERLGDTSETMPGEVVGP